MSNEAALIEAIRANPRDHTLPLILADFFDENSDPRGQWIRHYAVREWMRPDFQSPVPKLLESLAKDKRVIEVRRAAHVIGEPLVPGLIELLKHEKPRARQQACYCLRAIGSRAKAAVPALIETLSDPEHWVREQAAKALKEIGGDETADTSKLKGALTDINWNVRRAASAVLGKMGARGNVIEEIVERFDSPDAADRVASVQSLREVGTAEVVPHLASRLSDGAKEVRVAAVQALGSLKLSGTVPALLAAFADAEAEVRRAAAQQFNYSGRHGLYTDEAIAALAGLLKDRSAEVRQMACVALGRAKKRTASAEPALLKALTDQSPDVRQHAAEAISQVCPTPAAAEALLPRLADRNVRVAGAAARALAQCENLPRAFAEPILEYLCRAREANAWELPINTGLHALGRLADPPAAVLKALREALRGDHNESYAALHALRLLGPEAEPVLPDLLARLEQDQNAHNAMLAVLPIGSAAHARLAEIIDGPESPLRGTVIAHLWCGSAVPAGVLVPALVRAYHRAKDERKRHQILGAFRGFGATATDAIPLFLEVIEEYGCYHPSNIAWDAISAMREPLVPHLDRLAALAVRARLASWRGAFAKLFAELVPHSNTAFNHLRAMLRLRAPKSDSWSDRHGHTEGLTEALRGLMALHQKALPAVPDVLPLLTHENEHVRERAVTFFWFAPAPTAAPALCKAITDASDAVRAKAAEVLARQGEPTDATLKALAVAVEDRAVKVRRAAVETLNKLGTSSPSVLAALEAATEDADAKVKERAAVALRKLTPKARAKKKPR